MLYIYILKIEYEDPNIPKEFLLSDVFNSRDEASAAKKNMLTTMGIKYGNILELHMPKDIYETHYRKEKGRVSAEFIQEFLKKNSSYAFTPGAAASPGEPPRGPAAPPLQRPVLEADRFENPAWIKKELGDRSLVEAFLELREAGINPYYQLGISQKAEEKEIKNAFKVKSRQIHPDTVANQLMTELKVDNEDPRIEDARSKSTVAFQNAKLESCQKILLSPTAKKFMDDYLTYKACFSRNKISWTKSRSLI